MSPPEVATVLVVDDLPENVKLIAAILEMENYTIRTAQSGPEALESIQREAPDLVLLDVMMPGMDGIEVCRRIKQSDSESYLPVILVTAYGEAETKRLGLEAGAEDFISKPFDREELVARVRNILKTKRLYDDLSRSRQSMEDEVEAVAALQRSLLPRSPPDMAGIQIRDHYLPSRMAGGDYFDYLEIDDHRLGLAIGDVAGHGAHASVVMAMLKTALHLCEDCWARPELLLDKIDRYLARFVPEGEFVTLFYAVIDTEQKSMTFASAGHCRPILFGGGRQGPELLESPRAYPLCLERSEPFQASTLSLRPGDRMLLYTDGIVEAQNERGEMMGLDRIKSFLERYAEAPGEELCAALIEEARKFMGRIQFRDDCTFLLLEWPSEDSGRIPDRPAR